MSRISVLALAILTVLLAAFIHADDFAPATPNNGTAEYVRPELIQHTTQTDAWNGRFLFDLKIPPKVRHGLWFQEYQSAEKTKTIRYFQFEGLPDQVVKIGLTIGDGEGGLLGDQDDDLRYEFDATGSDKQGFTTFVSPVLDDLPLNQKVIRLGSSDDDWARRGKTDVVVFAIVPKSAPEDQPLEEIFPRAEMTVAPVVGLDKSRERDFKPGLLARLRTVWEAQQNEIGTAKVNYRNFRGFNEGLRDLGVEEVERLFAELSERPSSEEIREFALAVSSTQPETAQRLNDWSWPVNEFVEVGSKSRSTRPNGRGQDSVMLFDGRFVFDVSPHPQHVQVNIDTPKTNRMAGTNLSDMRTVPRLAETVGWRAREQGSRLIVMSPKLQRGGRSDEAPSSQSRIVLEVDSLTGFLHRQHKQVSGQVNLEDLVLQQGQQEFPGRVTFPTARLSARWLDGRLNQLELITIVDAEFNTGVDPQTFRLSVPEGSTLVDRRRSTYEPRVWRNNLEIVDLADHLDEQDLLSGK